MKISFLKYLEFKFPILKICRFCFSRACGLSFVERDPDEGKRVQNEDNCMAQHQIMNYRHNNKNGAHITHTFTLASEQRTWSWAPQRRRTTRRLAPDTILPSPRTDWMWKMKNYRISWTVFKYPCTSRISAAQVISVLIPFLAQLWRNIGRFYTLNKKLVG